VPGRYRSYGREDDQIQEDLEIGFSGFNNRVRPDQLQPGVLAESKNGRLDLNGEWQVRKGVNVLNVPFVTGSAVFRLPTAAEEESTTIGNLPRVMEGVSIATDGIVTVVLTGHGFSVGDEVVINGVFRASLPDINGSHTITVASGANRFKFDSGITSYTGSYTYPPAQGLITSFTLPFDPVTEILSTQPLSSPGGASILSEGAVTGVRAGTDYSDPNVAKDGEYIIASTNLSALVLKLSNQETFEMRFPDGESVLQRSDMLQAFNRLFIFRDSQVALENKKFFDPVTIKTISQTASTTVDVTTFLKHGLVDGDMVEIRDVAEGTINPNGQFEVISATDTGFTYNVGTSGTESYTVTGDSKVYPTFTRVAEGTYTQPAQLSTTITTDKGVTTCVSSSAHNLTTGNTVIVEDEAASNLENGEEYVATVVDSTTFTIFVPHPNESNTQNVIFEREVSIGLGFMHMPAPEFGVYHQRRLIVPFRYNQESINPELPTEFTRITPTGVRDEIAVSDILDSDTYDQVYAKFRFNAGTADFTVGLHSFSDDKLLVFNRNSIHLVMNSGNLSTAQTQLLTNEVGCVARDSIIQVGNNVLFLSDNGVYGANFQDLYNLRGNEVPLSEPINNTMKLINKDLWNQSSGVYFDNRYYLAVPLNEETVTVDGEGNVSAEITRAPFNNRIIIYNFLNKQWESVDNVGDSNFEYKKLIVAGDGEDRGVYILSTNGGIHRLDVLDQGNDRVITEVATGSEDLVTTPSIEGEMTTRMFTNKTIDRKKWNNFELQIQSHIDLKSDFFITGITENVDDTIDLKQLSSYLNNELLPEDEDVSIRGRIGNRRAYGFQFKIDRTTGRPRVRSLKVAAAEAFRSTREAI
jgi:hypothetical protein